MRLNDLNKPQMEAVIQRDRPLVVIAGAGCISGNTVIRFNRAGKGFAVTIRDAYRSFHQKQKNSSFNWDLKIPTHVRSFTGNGVRLHPILNIVKSGLKQLYLLRLENGYKLRATSDHLIFTNRGYVQLGDLTENDLVACDQLRPVKSETRNGKRYDQVVRHLTYHPYGAKDKNGTVRVEKHRLVYEADLNGISYDEYVRILRYDTGLARKMNFVNSKIYDVHHIDRDPTNNCISNLACLSRADHKRIHAEDQYRCFNQGVVQYVRLQSIKKLKVAMTYDIQCAPPHHNFVANGIVIHNSGKTRTLTHRVAYMIKTLGYLPSRLFVTTFTNKAAEEMKERLVPMIGERRAESLRIGTFHSLCRRMLIDMMEREMRSAFSSPRLLKGGGRFFRSQAWFAREKLDAKQTKIALKRISWWKNEGLRIHDLKEILRIEKGAGKPVSLDIIQFLPYYEVYEQHREEEGMIDYDDMLFQTYYKIIDPKNDKYLERQRSRIDQILVDEGQDLNRIQFMLTKVLSGDRRNVTLVADDWQILYGFRGALIDHFFEFKNWLQPEVIKLEQNYRSTKVIVDYGNSLIKHNVRQIKKVLFTENAEGVEPKVLVGFDPDTEAENVFEEIQQLILDEGYDLNDFAVIYRTNAQSRAMVDVLVKNQIPHKVHAPFGFYDRAEIKDVIAYVRICNNPFSAELEDFRRVINKPTRYLGKAFIDSVEEYQIENGHDTYWEAMCTLVSDDSFEISARQRNKAADFVSDISTINTWCVERGATTEELITKFLEVIDYQGWLEKEDEAEEEEEPDNNKTLNVDSLMIGAKRFANVDEFLIFIDSMNDKHEDEDDVIHLMTIHKSKGMEYACVFVMGFCDKLLPHYLAENPEEERRCAYVAITRAKERLFLSVIHGKYGRLNVTVSPYLKEMGARVPEFRQHGDVTSFSFIKHTGTGSFDIGPVAGVDLREVLSKQLDDGIIGTNGLDLEEEHDEEFTS